MNDGPEIITITPHDVREMEYVDSDDPPCHVTVGMRLHDGRFATVFIDLTKEPGAMCCTLAHPGC